MDASDAPLIQQTVDFAKKASLVGELATQLVEEKVSTQEKVAAAVPVLIDKLKNSGLLAAGQIKNAEALMNDHGGALDLLHDFVDAHTALQGEFTALKKSAASSLGTPQAINKSASAPGAMTERDRYRAADNAYREHLGLQPKALRG
jgi:hypothetical protein